MQRATPGEMLEAIRRLYDAAKIDKLLVSDDRTAYLADAWAGRTITIKLTEAGWAIDVTQYRGFDQQDRTLVEAVRKTTRGVVDAITRGWIS